MKKLVVLILVVITSNISQGQILGRIMNEAKRKVEQKVEDKIVQAVSEELARRAFKPIDEAMDSMMRQKYQDSVAHGQKVDWDKAGKAYGDFLAGMNRAVTLPEKYSFDVTQEVEVIDYSNKRTYLKLHYSKEGGYMGMETVDDKQEQQFIVMDMQQDAMVLFTKDKKGKKTGQAIPNVMKLSAGLAASVKTDEASKPSFRIDKTGNSKKVAGYTCSEYKGQTDEENVMMYVSDNFPVDMRKGYVAYMSRIAPASFTENSRQAVNGVMMEYENSRKDGKEKTTWVTKKVSEKQFSVNVSEYSFDRE